MNIFDAGIIGLLYEIGPYIAFGLAGIVILVSVIVLIAREKAKKNSEGAIGCLFTILVEVFFFFLFGYRSKKFIIAAILANLTSNLILNYIIYFLDLTANPNYGWILLAMEIGVWIYESLIYILVEKDKKKYFEIVLLTLAANCCSFIIGILLYLVYPLIGI